MYMVMEIQKWNDSVAHIVTDHNTWEEAESKFHQVLAAAAVSQVPVHSADLLSDDGTLIRNEKYVHNPQPAQNEEE